MGLKDTIAALLGISAYQTATPTASYVSLEDEVTRQVREALGGNIQPIPTTKLRWYLADLEAAQASADAGTMRPAAQLYRAMRRDGVLSGLLGSRAGGLVRLPNKLYGDAEIVEDLTRKNGTRSVFDEMFPPSELELLDSDGIVLGVGVAELVPVQGRPYPVMVRLDPEYLIYRWAENRWFFQSLAGLIPITPGDGRWILHTPGARIAPWTTGLWPALGRSFINKEHAMLHRSNYSAKLANPARLAYAPAGATEAQRLGFFQKLLRWGANTVVELPPGYEAKLLESNGRGWDVFQEEINTSDLEYMVSLSGQTVTTTGGAGFSNADVPGRVRHDLIRRDAEALAYTLNTQGIPQYIARAYGIEAINTRSTVVEWDTAIPKEQEAQARTLLAVGQALAQFAEILQGTDRRLDLDEIATAFGIPLEQKSSQVVVEQPELTAPSATKALKAA